MEYYICRESGEPVNILVWFGGQEIQGCSNALILESGDLILLKEVKRYSAQDRERFGDGTGKHYRAWTQEFGSNYASELLRCGVRKWQHRNEWWRNLKEQLGNAHHTRKVYTRC